MYLTTIDLKKLLITAKTEIFKCLGMQGPAMVIHACNPSTQETECYPCSKIIFQKHGGSLKTIP